MFCQHGYAFGFPASRRPLTTRQKTASREDFGPIIILKNNACSDLCFALFFESHFVSVEKSLQKPGEMNEITQWSLYLTQLTDPIFFLLLIFVPVPFFHLTFIHLQFSFSAWKGSYPPWKSQGEFLCSISKMHQLKLSGSHLSGKTNKQTKYKDIEKIKGGD